MNNVKKAREAKGFNQKEIAITLGVSQPTVSEWESGKKTPAGKNLKRLVELLDCSSDYLLGVTDDPAPSNTKKEAPGLMTPEAVMEAAEKQRGRPLTAEERTELLIRFNDLRDSLLRIQQEDQ